MKFHRNEDGVLVADGGAEVAPGNEAEAVSRASLDSHKEFFAKKGNTDDPAVVRQMLRRKKALEQLVQGSAQQIIPNTIEKKTISDKTFMELVNTKKEDRKGVRLWSEYAHLLMPPGKPVIRYQYPGEVGCYEKKGGGTVFLFLEEPIAKGHIIQNNPLAKE